MICSSAFHSLRMAQVQTRFKHTVRIVLTQTVGERQSGEVFQVSAGYARNFLIPKKMALYAIPQNFERLGLKDPDIETEEERRQRLIQMAADEANVDLVAANILQKYLRNKHVTIWRHVDPETNAVYPGMVDQLALRQKLYRQLKIELEEHEHLHIREKPVDSHEKMTDEELDGIMAKIDTSTPCQVQLRQLGKFVAKITLAGGYTVPLKFVVLKR